MTAHDVRLGPGAGVCYDCGMCDYVGDVSREPSLAEQLVRGLAASRPSNYGGRNR